VVPKKGLPPESRNLAKTSILGERVLPSCALQYPPLSRGSRENINSAGTTLITRTVYARALTRASHCHGQDAQFWGVQLFPTLSPLTLQAPLCPVDPHKIALSRAVNEHLGWSQEGPLRPIAPSSGLKIRRASALGGSTPPPGTTRQRRAGRGLQPIGGLEDSTPIQPPNRSCDAGVTGRGRSPK